VAQGRQTGGVGVNVLLDTHVLSELMRQRLPKGRRRARLDSYVQAVLASGLTVLALRHHSCALAQRTAGQIAAIAATRGLVLVTRNTSDFEMFDGLQLLNWFAQP
jgi:tRNA(fMet)-specific endonuclease VapC